MLGRRVNIAVVDYVIGAERLCLLKLRVIYVGGDDAHGSKRAHELNRHVAEPAYAYHHDGSAGVKMREGALYGVIRSQRGVA
jgi:hypothetical protein